MRAWLGRLEGERVWAGPEDRWNPGLGGQGRVRKEANKTVDCGVGLRRLGAIGSTPGLMGRLGCQRSIQWFCLP